MKSSDSHRELEDRLSLLQPKSTSPELDGKLKELTKVHSEQNPIVSLADSQSWNRTFIGLVTAAALLVIVASIAMRWKHIDETDTTNITSKSITRIPDPEISAIANFNLAMGREDIDTLLDRQCNSFLPSYPLTDVSLNGSNRLFQQH